MRSSVRATATSGSSPRSTPCTRASSRANAWNVVTRSVSWLAPMRSSARARSSTAASRVKVRARISVGEAPCSTSHARRWQSTRVLPAPAPASTIAGPPGWVTAARCSGVRSSSTDRSW